MADAGADGQSVRKLAKDDVLSHKNVFSDKELNRESNIQKMYIGGSDKPVLLHSLDVIISVGYRVKSVRGVHFRKWATEILRTRLLYAQRKRRDQRARVEAFGALASHVLTDDEARALQRPRRDCPACCRKQPEAKRHGNPANIGDAFLTAH